MSHYHPKGLGLLPSEFYISTDKSLLDIDAIWAYLHGEAYWSKDRTRERLERQVAGCCLAVGLYERDGSRDGKGRLVGFARVIGDGEAVAYLTDVFVVKSLQGKGLGRYLLDETLNADGRDEWFWMLHTSGREAWYEEYFGFRPQASVHSFRERMGRSQERQ